MSDFNLKAQFAPSSKQTWIQKIQADLKGALAEEALTHRLGDDLELDAFYTRQDLASLPHLDAGSPYQHVTWIRRPGWHLCQPIDLSLSPSDARQKAKTALSKGATAIAFEQTGAPEIDNLSLFRTTLKGIDLDTVPIYFFVDPPYARRLYATPEFERLVRGSISLMSHSSRKAASNDLWISDCLARKSSLKTMHLVLPNAREKPGHCLGEMLLHLHHWTERAAKTGHSFDSVFRALQLVVHVGTSFYLEIARMRAIRYLISRLIHDRHPVPEPAFDSAFELPILAETDSSPYSSEPDYTNLVAATTMAMSAVLGGCDVLIVRPHDLNVHATDFEGARLALNVQLILRHEVHLNHVIDPAAGSYYVETLTHQLIQNAWNHYEDSLH